MISTSLLQPEITTGFFPRIARWCEHQVSRPGTSVAAMVFVVLWFMAGPLYGWSNAWQLIVNTTSSVITLVMVFLIQYTQRRDTQAIQMKLDNQVEGPLWIKEIKAEVETADGKKYSDSAAPGVDGPRYMEAFPALQEAKADWLKEDLKIPTRTSFNGVAIFSYPVAKEAFDNRKQVTLRIQLYDRPTLVATSIPTPGQRW